MTKIFEAVLHHQGRTGKGTGLGLSTVYGIVKQHDGFIYADKRTGALASRFNVYLPVPIDRRGAVGPAAGSGRARWGRVILVVEDEPEVRQILVEALSGLGYQVRQAADGVEALEMLQRGLRGRPLLTRTLVIAAKWVGWSCARLRVRRSRT